MKFFQRTGFGKSTTFFGGPFHFPYMMGLGQGNRAAPPSWIQLSVVLVNVFKQLNLGAAIHDPITAEIIHSMGALFVNNIDLYTWRENILDPGELWGQAQLELGHWSCLLNPTGGALKPEKCFCYLLDYECVDGEWTYSEMVPQEMVITNPDGTTSPIKQEQVTSSKKTLGIHDSPSGGNSTHLAFIKEKVSVWVSRMTNGHLPSHMAWVAYRHHLWPGVQYGLGTITNDLEVTDNLLHKEDHWRNFIKLLGGPPRYVVITNVLLRCPPTTSAASDQVRNARTYAATSRRSNHSLTAHFITYMYTATWTDYSNGSNSRYPSNSTAYATLW